MIGKIGGEEEQQQVNLSLTQRDVLLLISGLEKLELFLMHKACKAIPQDRLNEFDHLIDVVEELQIKLCAISYLAE